MRKELIDRLKDLNMRIHCKGFSWQHEDFFTLQEALPLIVGGFGDASDSIEQSVNHQKTDHQKRQKKWKKTKKQKSKTIKTRTR